MYEEISKLVNNLIKKYQYLLRWDWMVKRIPSDLQTILEEFSKRLFLNLYWDDCYAICLSVSQNERVMEDEFVDMQFELKALIASPLYQAFLPYARDKNISHQQKERLFLMLVQFLPLFTFSGFKEMAHHDAIVLLNHYKKWSALKQKSLPNHLILDDLSAFDLTDAEVLRVHFWVVQNETHLDIFGRSVTPLKKHPLYKALKPFITNPNAREENDKHLSLLRKIIPLFTVLGKEDLAYLLHEIGNASSRMSSYEKEPSRFADWSDLVSYLNTQTRDHFDNLPLLHLLSLSPHLFADDPGRNYLRIILSHPSPDSIIKTLLDLENKKLLPASPDPQFLQLLSSGKCSHVFFEHVATLFREHPRYIALYGQERQHYFMIFCYLLAQPHLFEKSPYEYPLRRRLLPPQGFKELVYTHRVFDCEPKERLDKVIEHADYFLQRDWELPVGFIAIDFKKLIMDIEQRKKIVLPDAKPKKHRTKDAFFKEVDVTTAEMANSAFGRKVNLTQGAHR